MRENDGWRFAGEKDEQAVDRLRPGYCGKRKADHPGNFCQVRRRPLPPLRAPGPAGQYWQRRGDHDRHRDLRNVLERSSARETTLRVALGNIAQQFLRQLDIDLVAYVAQVGPVEADSEKPLDVSEIRQKIFQNDMHVIDQDKVEDLHQLISETKEKDDTLGGIYPPGSNWAVTSAGTRNWTPSLPRPLSGSMPWAIPARRIVFCWEFWPAAPLPVN